MEHEASNCLNIKGLLITSCVTKRVTAACFERINVWVVEIVAHVLGRHSVLSGFTVAAHIANVTEV
jgi:hypothetical protein